MVNPVCIRIALTARVAEQLRDGPKPVAELASAAGMDADKLGRVLRNLATKHCFREGASLVLTRDADELNGVQSAKTCTRTTNSACACSRRIPPVG